MIVMLSCLRGLHVLHLVVILPKEVATLRTLLFLRFPKVMREISEIADVSERTFYRRIAEYDLKIRAFSRVSDNQLDLEVLALTNVYPFCGESC